jgi:hypothetical protein
MKRAISAISIIALIAAQTAPAWAQQPPPPAQTDQFTRSDYEACQTKQEDSFREAIRTITLKALKRGTANLDYLAIVTDQWRAGGFDAIVDQRVDIAAAQVRDETAWSELLKSLAYRKQAQELAKATAERTYRSTAIKAALEELATNVGREIGSSIVLTTADAAEPAQRCLKAYLGPRYGSTVARSVNQQAGAAFKIDPKLSQAKVSKGRLLLETSAGITGAVLLLVRRQMARMAQQIGQRIVGSILGRLVSVVAGGVGIVLIAKEFWELRHGVLPIVAKEMKSANSKAKVREELAKSIKEQIDSHLDELASRTADKIVDIWHGFRRAHAKVVQLAERDAAFKAFVDTASPAQLPRLDEIVALILDHEGPDAVGKRLENGTLQTALNKMPPLGMQIAREQQSLSKALAWSALAGDLLPKVIAFDVHKHTKPDAMSRAGLVRILALDDRLAITRVAGIDGDARTILLEMERANLVTLARTLTETELQNLARYLTGLEPDASQRVLRVIGASPAKMRNIATTQIRDGILASRDQAAAIGMMLSDTPIFDVVSIYRHVEMVWLGRVNPVLIWAKHPGVVIALAVLLIIVLSMLRSLLFGRRRKTPPTSKKASA